MRKIRSHLKADRWYRAATVGAIIVGHLNRGDLAEAWRCLKAWSITAEDRPPKPCQEMMETQTAKREEVYKKAPPPMNHIPINVEPKEI